MKILMVCLGNICRSPLAEGILLTKIRDKSLLWEVDSAGTSAYHAGDLPDTRSIRVAAKHGLDISYQRSRKVTQRDLDEFDLIFAMDASNFRNLNQLTINNEQRKKIKLIMNEAFPDENRGVPDPYWDDDGFQKVYDMLDLACGQIIKNYG